MNTNNSMSKFFSAFLLLCLSSSTVLANTIPDPVPGAVKILPLGGFNH